MAKAVIFDCDGTLVDTEELCASVDVEIYAENGIYFKDTAEFLSEFIGVANAKIVSILNARHGKNISADYFLKEFVRRSLPRIDTDMRWFPESLEFVRRLAARGVPLAVASNGKRDLVMKELKISGYLEFIPADCVFAVEDTEHPKPAPDLYLQAAAKLGMAPVDCLAVEDSAAGAQGAVAAGMRVAGYTGLAHVKTGRDNILTDAGCFKIINDLTELNALIA
jgi:HAD superfamily hydrolase (TIGR01509 family)